MCDAHTIWVRETVTRCVVQYIRQVIDLGYSEAGLLQWGKRVDTTSHPLWCMVGGATCGYLTSSDGSPALMPSAIY
jgi:hypothetical protein